MEIKIKAGLRPLPKDNRDFRLSSILVLPKLEELPEEFMLEPLTKKHQKDSDFCTAFMSCGMSEIQEGVPLSPEWSFAVSKMISGDPYMYGQNLRDAMKAHVKYGAVEIKDNPVTLENANPNFLRDIKNYPKDLFEKAKAHKKQSFFYVDGQYDHFDDIRAAIYYFRDKKRAVGLGVSWLWDLMKSLIQKELGKGGVGHAIYCLGWKTIKGELRLAIMNSYGDKVGDKGIFYFPRNVINYMIEKYGLYMFVDMPPEEAKKVCWSIWRRIWEAIRNFFNNIFK